MLTGDKGEKGGWEEGANELDKKKESLKRKRK
jgi:hypothetical protein